jgi:HK97 family phage prohead protease
LDLKLFAGSVVADPALTDRQIRVVANSGKSDRVKDVLVAKGCQLDNYRKNPIVLADHDPSKPVGNFAPEIRDAVEGVITFAPKGISAKADEYCGLYKAGVLNTVSVGFRPIDFEPNKGGGYDYKQWELMELSCVAVPCDADALVTARAFRPPSPALAGEGRGEGSSHKSAAAWKVGASRNLPLGGDEAWDGPAAEASIWAHCGFDGDKPDAGFARKAFLAYDSANPAEKGSYKLPFAKVVDGRLTAMPSGVRAAASRLPAAGISDEARTKARAVLDHYEAKMGSDDDGKAVLTAFIAKWGTAPELKLIDELLQAHKGGRVLSAENMAHVQGIIKCFGRMSDCRVKALDSHGTLHADLQAFADHIDEGVGHAKALMNAAKKKPKPQPGEGDGGAGPDADTDPDNDYEDPDDDDSNVELAFEIERRKRALALLTLGS